MAILLDGKELAKKIRESQKEEVINLKKNGVFPKLAVIMVGKNSASEIYVRNKSKVCNEIGIDFNEYLLEEKTTMKELKKLITTLNEKNDINGILLQSPIPSGLNINEAFECISPTKDVDGFHPENIGKLCLGPKA